ncbi:glutathione S-transferase T3-like [Brassica napus]|uniref:glutathione S-transferase T3-like n=1 Tax=Brassica napus TaxID=3708 RepID=UPI0020792E0E|nr:glutathione S-transferase T3-like [Brassica napus]
MDRNPPQSTTLSEPTASALSVLVFSDHNRKEVQCKLWVSQQDSVIPQSFPWESSSQVPVFSTQCTETSSFCEESSTQRKERKKWTPSDDLVLISAWLNTSKDPVVSNEQKAGTFWNRIAAYYAASPKVESGDKRGALQCKQRWQKINDLVCKFCGSYAAATRQKTSGQSESDVVKLAHEIFFNDQKIKFNLHHAWEELRYDQKWCEHASSKLGGSAKKRKCEDGAETESSQATINVDDLPTKRPAGVKAAKAASAKKPIVDKEADEKFGKLCSIKEKDLVLTERVSKMRLLDSLITKKEPLSEKEEALKSKLLTEMLDAP